MKNIKVFGDRVLVEKERIDIGALKLTPGLEEDGQKNIGKIIAVGQIGLRAKLRGVRKGKTIYFKKYFIPNTDSQDQLTFVAVEDIIGIL